MQDNLADFQVLSQLDLPPRIIFFPRVGARIPAHRAISVTIDRQA
jgi:hypothetical protein